MNKTLFLESLEHFVADPEHPDYERALAEFLYWYFDLYLSDNGTLSWSSHVLPRALTEAIEFLRTNQSSSTKGFRNRILTQSMLLEIPSLTELSVPGGSYFYRSLFINRVCSVIGTACNTQDLDKLLLPYFMAQDNLVLQVFHSFIQDVYMHGMRLVLEANKFSTMSGIFATTYLTIVNHQGDLKFRFVKAANNKQTNAHIWLSFNLQDKNGYRADITDVTLDVWGAIQLIRNVIQLWKYENPAHPAFLKPEY